MNDTRPAFVSGWAGYSELFPAMRGRVRFFRPFASLAKTELLATLGRGGRLLVAWSAGAHLVLRHQERLFPVYDQILLVAPFLSFSDGLPQKTLIRMQQRFEHDPLRVLAQFYRNCGILRPKFIVRHLSDREKKRLSAGLDWLLSSRAEINPSLRHDHVCLVLPQADRIVLSRAVNRVCRSLPQAQTRPITCGHYVPEGELARIGYETTATALL
jgi:hypothetical protein